MLNHQKFPLEKPQFLDPCNGCGLCCLKTVCGAGSFSMGLVDNYGERADGPCPAIVTEEDGSICCGMVLRPKDYAPAERGSAHELRRAIQILIGGGIGCDVPDTDDQDASAAAEKLLEKYSREEIHRAAQTWYGDKL